MSAPYRSSESTARLLEQARGGDEAARDHLVGRYLPVLRRWARGRLPNRARDAVDTDDLVQVTLMRALGAIDRFEPRHEGAFLAYLRRILLNALRDEIRRAAARPQGVELDSDLTAELPSPVEQAIGRERFAAYEAALVALDEKQQEAIILRLEMGFSHQQVAEAIGCSSPDAARMLVARAVQRLAETIDGRG
jgi:RNA polymerase sigma-70 factor (ECF subfamily)